MPETLDTYDDDAAGTLPSEPTPPRSIYALTRKEITRGIANRFVYSRTYIVLYLVMAALSVTTVALSLSDGCPGLAFYVLEIIINTSMILEVGVRFVAFGRQFWRSPYNTLDLILTLFCAITLLVLAFSDCDATSKEEELLDTLLLIARNVLQFGRLAAVMRQSGQSIFSRPRPIDISTIRRAGYRSLDLDLEDEDADADAELGQPLMGEPALFDAQEDAQPERMSDMPRAAQAVRERDAEDVWAELG